MKRLYFSLPVIIVCMLTVFSAETELLASSGDVVVVNGTGQTVKIHYRYSANNYYTWTLSPNQQGYLRKNGVRIRTNNFRFTLEWNGNTRVYSGGTYDSSTGALVVRLGIGHLPSRGDFSSTIAPRQTVNVQVRKEYDRQYTSSRNRMIVPRTMYDRPQYPSASSRYSSSPTTSTTNTRKKNYGGFTSRSGKVLQQILDEARARRASRTPEEKERAREFNRKILNGAKDVCWKHSGTV